MTTDLSTAALLSQRYGAPVWLFERSAAARAKASQSTVDAVLDGWVQEDASPQTPVPSPEKDASPQTPVASPEEADGPTEPAPASSSPSGGGADEGGGGGQTLTGAALLTAVADARGMPESLIQRSAQARAGAAGVSLDDVLHEWAEEEGLEAPTPPMRAPGPKSATTSPLPTPVPKPESTTPVATGLTGAALLTAVAEARGMPETLVERSAAARAKKTDATVEDILNEWAQEAGITATDPAESPAPPSSPSGEGTDAGGGGGQAPDAPAPEPETAPESTPRQTRSWRHSVAIGAVAALVPLVMLVVLAVFVDVPSTLSDAPWYLVGLEPFLDYLEPFMALVIIPGVVLSSIVILAVVAWNPAVHPSTRRLVLMMLVFLILLIGALSVIGALQA